MSQDKNNTPETPEEPYEGILGDYTEAEETAEEAKPSKKQKKSDSAKDGSQKSGSKKALTIAGISASVVLLGCLGFVGVSLMKNQGGNSIAVASTQNMDVSKQMMACYYKDIITSYIDYYGEDYLLSYYQLDVSQPLKDQMYPVNDGTTWFYQIMAAAKSTAAQQLMVAEAGKAAGFALDEETEQSVEEQLAGVDISLYGNDVTIEDLRNKLLLQAYSTAYYEVYYNSLTFSDEEIETFYNDYKLEYDSCDIACFNIYFEDTDGEEDAGEETSAEEETASEEEGDSGEEASDEDTESEETDDSVMTRTQAKAFADELAAAQNAQAFEKLAGDYLVEYEGYSEDDLDSVLPSIYNTDYYYTEGSELAEWAFGGAKVGDTYIVEGDSAYYVYMLTREPGRDESRTVNVRHILYLTDEHVSEGGDEETALAECWELAENCLNEWKSGEATEDSFAALATAYTEDPGSQSTGGLYENVYEGQMVTNFNDWCFDESRKPGDTDIIETSYGVHVMYFVGEADPVWKADVIYELRSNALEQWFAELETLYPVTFNDDEINSIEG